MKSKGMRKGEAGSVEKFCKSDLQRMIEEAEMVLVGLGPEFDEYGIEDPEALALLDLLQGSGYDLVIPAVRDGIREKNGKKQELMDAVLQLSKLIEGKNFFLVTQSETDCIGSFPWKDARLVNMREWDAHYRDEVDEADRKGQLLRGRSGIDELLQELLKGEIREYLDRNAGLSVLPPQVAEAMRRIMIQEISDRVGQKISRLEDDIQLRTGGTEKPDEGGNPEDGGGNSGKVCKNPEDGGKKAREKGWARYEKWLQGTMNRKLLLLELGVGISGGGSCREVMDRDNMIRNPFERIAFLNQKSRICRINGTLGNLPEKLAEKGVGFSENAIDWLRNI